uniref:C-type lectin domain-containing protein n=1 Tax=Xiphophorus couchianus TaxID=32473 RepID=A0A3B5MBX3_9TELE
MIKKNLNKKWKEVWIRFLKYSKRILRTQHLKEICSTCSSKMKRLWKLGKTCFYPNPPNLTCFMFTAQCCFIDCQLYQFHYINQNKNWTEAQQYCREKHTDLATVTNMKDMERLNNISAGYKTAAWIGLYDQTNGNRTWFWSLPGLEFNESETNWNQGEPSDKGIQGSENCGAMNKDLTWLDDGCQKTKYFLCYDGEY